MVEAAARLDEVFNKLGLTDKLISDYQMVGNCLRAMKARDCDDLYVEYQTENTLTYGYVTLDDGVWISENVYFSESDYLRELYIYAADEDEDGQSTTLIILITLVDSNGVERDTYDMIDGIDPDGDLYYYW